jgi:hypothetical protein
MHAWNVPQAEPIVYGEGGRLFDAEDRILSSEAYVDDLLGKVNANRIFLKFDVSYGGTGVQCFSRVGGSYLAVDGTAFDFSHLQRTVANADFICQEGLRQIPELAELNPESVNTLRIMTRFRGQAPEVVATLLRVGRKGSFVDNATVGGLSCHVDIDNWKTSGTAVLWNSHPYEFCERHPDSGALFDGVQLRFREETLELVTSFAAKFPGCEIIGWDIALTDSGPKIVEVNWNPDVDLPQMSGRIGLADIYFG